MGFDNNGNSDGNSDFIELTGLWRNNNDNDLIASGSLGNGQVLIFRNKYKEKENQPDFKMFLVKKTRRDEGPQDGGNSGKGGEKLGF